MHPDMIANKNPAPVGLSQYTNSLIVWNEAHDTGIHIINEQHRSIIGTINTLFHHMINSKGKNISGAIAITFKHLLQIHFETERLYLVSSDCTYMNMYDMHCHDTREQFFRVEITSRSVNDPTVLLDFFKTWWSVHMECHTNYYTSWL